MPWDPAKAVSEAGFVLEDGRWVKSKASAPAPAGPSPKAPVSPPAKPSAKAPVKASVKPSAKPVGRETVTGIVKAPEPVIPAGKKPAVDPVAKTPITADDLYDPTVRDAFLEVYPETAGPHRDDDDMTYERSLHLAIEGIVKPRSAQTAEQKLAITRIEHAEARAQARVDKQKEQQRQSEDDAEVQLLKEFQAYPVETGSLAISRYEGNPDDLGWPVLVEAIRQGAYDDARRRHDASYQTESRAGTAAGAKTLPQVNRAVANHAARLGLSLPEFVEAMRAAELPVWEVMRYATDDADRKWAAWLKQRNEAVSRQADPEMGSIIGNPPIPEPLSLNDMVSAREINKVLSPFAPNVLSDPEDRRKLVEQKAQRETAEAERHRQDLLMSMALTADVEEAVKEDLSGEEIGRRQRLLDEFTREKIGVDFGMPVLVGTTWVGGGGHISTANALGQDNALQVIQTIGLTHPQAVESVTGPGYLEKGSNRIIREYARTAARESGRSWDGLTDDEIQGFYDEAIHLLAAQKHTGQYAGIISLPSTLEFTDEPETWDSATDPRYEVIGLTPDNGLILRQESPFAYAVNVGFGVPSAIVSVDLGHDQAGLKRSIPGRFLIGTEKRLRTLTGTPLKVDPDTNRVTVTDEDGLEVEIKAGRHVDPFDLEQAYIDGIANRNSVLLTGIERATTGDYGTGQKIGIIGTSLAIEVLIPGGPEYAPGTWRKMGQAVGLIRAGVIQVAPTAAARMLFPVEEAVGRLAGSRSAYALQSLDTIKGLHSIEGRRLVASASEYTRMADEADALGDTVKAAEHRAAAAAQSERAEDVARAGEQAEANMRRNMPEKAREADRIQRDLLDIDKAADARVSPDPEVRQAARDPSNENLARAAKGVHPDIDIIGDELTSLAAPARRVLTKTPAGDMAAAHAGTFGTVDRVKNVRKARSLLPTLNIPAKSVTEMVDDWRKVAAKPIRSLEKLAKMLEGTPAGIAIKRALANAVDGFADEAAFATWLEKADREVKEGLEEAAKMRDAAKAKEAAGVVLSGNEKRLAGYKDKTMTIIANGAKNRLARAAGHMEESWLRAHPERMLDRMERALLWTRGRRGDAAAVAAEAWRFNKVAASVLPGAYAAKMAGRATSRFMPFNQYLAESLKALRYLTPGALTEGGVATRASLMAASGMSEKDAHAIAAIIDQLAAAWSELHGRPVTDYYREVLAGIEGPDWVRPGGILDTLEADAQALFYSELRAVAEQRLPAMASPDQIRAFLSKGTKQEELAWTDLDGFLDEARASGRKSIPRQEVLDWLDAHAVQINDIVRGWAADPRMTEAIKRVDALMRQAGRSDSEIHHAIAHPGWHAEDSVDWPDLPVDQQQAISAALSEVDKLKQTVQVPAWEQYVQPGSYENYVEHVITSSVQPPTRETLERAAITAKYDESTAEITIEAATVPAWLKVPGPGPHVSVGEGGRVAVGDAVLLSDGSVSWMDPFTDVEHVFDSVDEAAASMLARLAEIRLKEGVFKSRHWPDDINVLVHGRTTERVTEAGKKVRAGEEVQSDWQQAARVRGTTVEENAALLDKARQKRAAAKMTRQETLTAAGAARNKLSAVVDDINARSIDGPIIDSNRLAEIRLEWSLDPAGVDAPRAVLDALREDRTAWNAAADAGIVVDKLLDKIDGIALGPVPKAPFRTTWPDLMLKRLLRDAADDESIEGFVLMPGERVQAVVGGEIEGQKKFYDEILVKKLDTIIKKAGGKGVSTTTIRLGDAVETVPYVEFTPGLRQRLQQPASLFHVPEAGKAEDLGEASETVLMHGTIDIERMIEMQGAQLYDSNLPNVVVKELLQNAHDAVRAESRVNPQLAGKIDIAIDTDKHTISLTDNGIGMSPETVETAFLRLFASGKTAGESGGFGMAKLVFLFGSDASELETVHNGVRTVVKTGRKQLIDAVKNGKPIPTTVTRGVSAPNGTKITVTLPETVKGVGGRTSDIRLPAYSGHLYSLSRPLISDAEITFKSAREDKVLALGKNFNRDGHYRKLLTGKTDWGEVDVYIGRDRSSYPSRQVLSSGVSQFDITVKNVPYNLIFDARPTVAANHAQYPFTRSREGFVSAASDDMGPIIEQVQLFVRGEEATATAQQFKNARPLPLIDLDQIDSGSASRYWQQAQPTLGRPDASVQSADDWQRFADAVESTSPKTKADPISTATTGAAGRRSSVVETDVQFSGGAELVGSQVMRTDRPILHSNLNTDIIAEATKQGTPTAPEMFVAEIGSLVWIMRNDIGKTAHGYGALAEGSTYAVGVSFDKTYKGVHVRAAYNAFFLNPLASRASTPIGLATDMVQTIAHEAAHLRVMEHDESFVLSLHDVIGKLADTGRLRSYEDAFMSIFGRHNETFQTMRRIYDRSDVRNLADPLAGGAKLPVRGPEGPTAGVSGRGGGQPEAVRSAGAGEGRRPEGVAAGADVGRVEDVRGTGPSARDALLDRVRSVHEAVKTDDLGEARVRWDDDSDILDAPAVEAKLGSEPTIPKPVTEIDDLVLALTEDLVEYRRVTAAGQRASAKATEVSAAKAVADDELPDVTADLIDWDVYVKDDPWALIPDEFIIDDEMALADFAAGLISDDPWVRIPSTFEIRVFPDEVSFPVPTDPGAAARMPVIEDLLNTAERWAETGGPRRKLVGNRLANKLSILAGMASVGHWADEADETLKTAATVLGRNIPERTFRLQVELPVKTWHLRPARNPVFVPKSRIEAVMAEKVQRQRAKLITTMQSEAWKQAEHADDSQRAVADAAGFWLDSAYKRNATGTWSPNDQRLLDLTVSRLRDVPPDIKKVPAFRAAAAKAARKQQQRLLSSTPLGAVAAAHIMDDGRVIIQALTRNVTARDFIHEIGHVLRRYLDGDLQTEIVDWLKGQGHDVELVNGGMVRSVDVAVAKQVTAAIEAASNDLADLRIRLGEIDEILAEPKITPTQQAVAAAEKANVENKIQALNSRIQKTKQRVAARVGVWTDPATGLRDMHPELRAAEEAWADAVVAEVAHAANFSAERYGPVSRALTATRKQMARVTSTILRRPDVYQASSAVEDVLIKALRQTVIPELHAPPDVGIPVQSVAASVRMSADLKESANIDMSADTILKTVLQDGQITFPVDVLGKRTWSADDIIRMDDRRSSLNTMAGRQPTGDERTLPIATDELGAGRTHMKPGFVSGAEAITEVKVEQGFYQRMRAYLDDPNKTKSGAVRNFFGRSTFFAFGEDVQNKALRDQVPQVRVAEHAIRREVSQVMSDVARFVFEAHEKHGDDLDEVYRYLGGEDVRFYSDRPVSTSGDDRVEVVVDSLLRSWDRLPKKAKLALRELADDLYQSEKFKAKGFAPSQDTLRKIEESEAITEATRRLITGKTADDRKLPGGPNRFLADVMETVRERPEGKLIPQDQIAVVKMLQAAGIDDLLFDPAQVMNVAVGRRSADIAKELAEAAAFGRRDELGTVARMHTAIMIGTHGSLGEVGRMASDLGLTVPRKLAKHFSKWVMGEAIPAEMLPQMRQLAQRFGFSPRFTDLVGSGPHGMSVPGAVEDVLYGPGGEMSMASQALQEAMKPGGSTTAGDFAMAFYRYIIVRQVSGGLIPRPRYYFMNTILDPVQIASGVGPAAAARSLVRTAPQIIAPAFTHAAVLVGWAIERVLKVDAPLAEGMRSALQAMGDRASQAMRLILQDAPFDIRVNAVLNGDAAPIRFGDRLISGKELLRIARQEGMFGGQDVSLLQDAISRIMVGKNMQRDRRWWRLDKKLYGAFRDSFRVTRDAAEAWGERQRIGTMVTLIEQGIDPRQAARATNTLLFDYAGTAGDFADSPRMQMVFKLFQPYWTWAKNANRLFANMLSDPETAYRVMAWQRLGYRGPQAISGALHAVATDSYDVSVPDLDAAGLAYYWTWRTMIEWGMGHEDGWPESVQQWVVSNYMDVVQPPFEQGYQPSFAEVWDRVPVAQKQIMRYGYGGPENVPENVRMGARMLMSGRNVAYDEGRAYRVHPDIAESMAGPHSRRPTEGATITRYDRTALPAHMADKAAIMFPAVPRNSPYYTNVGKHMADLPLDERTYAFAIPDTFQAAVINQWVSGAAFLVNVWNAGKQTATGHPDMAAVIDILKPIDDYASPERAMLLSDLMTISGATDNPPVKLSKQVGRWLISQPILGGLVTYKPGVRRPEGDPEAGKVIEDDSYWVHSPIAVALIKHVPGTSLISEVDDYYKMLQPQSTYEQAIRDDWQAPGIGTPEYLIGTRATSLFTGFTLTEISREKSGQGALPRHTIEVTGLERPLPQAKPEE